MSLKRSRVELDYKKAELNVNEKRIKLTSPPNQEVLFPTMNSATEANKCDKSILKIKIIRNKDGGYEIEKKSSAAEQIQQTLISDLYLSSDSESELDDFMSTEKNRCSPELKETITSSVNYAPSIKQKQERKHYENTNETYTPLLEDAMFIRKRTRPTLVTSKRKNRTNIH